MSVRALSPDNETAVTMLASHRPEKTRVETVRNQNSPAAITVATDGAANPDDSSTDVQGVIRLLEAGHFQGVADVRLRINFHEELMARQAEAVKSAVEAKLPSLTQSVDDAFDAFVAGESLEEAQSTEIDAIRATFEQAVTDLSTAFQAEAYPGINDYVNGLQSAFDAMLSSLRELFTVAPDATDPIPPTDGSPDGKSVNLGVEAEPDPPEPTVLYEDFLASLSAEFAAALTDFTESLRTAGALPELSEPKGNGAAYDKFLATYNDLWNPTSGQDTPDTEPVNELA
jgi:hypothetical protein